MREIIRAGANVIKVHTSGGVLSPRDSPKHAQFRPDELAALMAEATAAGLPVMAHAQATDGIKNALRAGVRSIEHGIYLDDEAIDMMLSAGAWLVPTLVAPHAVLNAASAGSQLPDGVAGEGAGRDRRARQRVRARGGGRRQDRHGHRQRGRAARQQPRRAAADGRRRDDPGAGADGDDQGRPPSCCRSATRPARSCQASARTWSCSAGDPFDLANLKANIRAVYAAGRKVR